LIAVLALAAAALKSLFFRLATYVTASRRSTNPTQITLLTHLTCVTLLIVPLSILSFHRARIFASDEALWRDTLARNPAAWVAHNNLGSILAEQHNYEDAAAHFMTSLQLKPDNAQAHCNLGSLLALQGRFSEAEAHFLAALKTKPNDADIHKAYASALSAQGKTLEALKHTRAAISLHPDPALRLSYASLLYQTGDFREAVAQYRQVLAAGAESPEPLNNLAWLLATCPDSAVRNGKEAVLLAERACRLSKFREPSMLGVLAAAYAEAGRFNDAMGAAQQTISLATAAGNTRFAAMNQQLLQLYRAGKPYHEPHR
jgi:Flp pilus assembly protein TadD